MKLKKYYDILGLYPYEDSQDIILFKYKKVTNHLRTHFPVHEVRKELIDVNESFLVLSDKELKGKYDYALKNKSVNDDLLELLSVKRQKAEQFINDKLSSVPPNRKKSKWPAILCGLLLFSIFGLFSRTCANALLQEDNSQTKANLNTANAHILDSFSTPSDWDEYTIDDAISISIPSTMELRHEYDDYTQFLSDSLGLKSYPRTVFQQKNLSSRSPEAYSTYARVLMQHFTCSPGDVEHHYESPQLTPEDYQLLREMVDEEVLPYTYVYTPTWRWININGTKAIEGSYRRNGSHGSVNCKFYILFNYSEIAKVLISFREKDSDMWETDLNNVIKTFKWKSPR